MEKIISIVIPTYNMEKYLNRCVDSLLICKGLDDVEILIVNDGSRDRSSEIAHCYKSKYPHIVSVIDKLNGNYGSCINEALSVAVGKYIKILDADDFFNTPNFEMLVSSLKNIDSDVVLTNHTIITPKMTKLWKHPYENGRVFDLDLECPKYFPMHSVLYRTDLLREIKYSQLEGISYTDQEWIFYPMLVSKKMVYIDIDVYQYCMDRGGQTMDPVVFKKNMPALCHILNRALRYSTTRVSQTSGHRQYCKMQLFRQAETIYKNILISRDTYEREYDLLRDLDIRIRDSYPELYYELNNASLGYIKYIARFHKSGEGLSFLEIKSLPIQYLMKRVLNAIKRRVSMSL